MTFVIRPKCVTYFHIFSTSVVITIWCMWEIDIMVKSWRRCIAGWKWTFGSPYRFYHWIQVGTLPGPFQNRDHSLVKQFLLLWFALSHVSSTTSYSACSQRPEPSGTSHGFCHLDKRSGFQLAILGILGTHHAFHLEAGLDLDHNTFSTFFWSLMEFIYKLQFIVLYYSFLFLSHGLWWLRGTRLETRRLLFQTPQPPCCALNCP